MTAKRVSLADFAKQNPGRLTVPWIETLPEYEEIVAAYKAGVAGTTIRRWLTSPPPDGPGYPPSEVTHGRVDNYLCTRFRRG